MCHASTQPETPRGETFLRHVRFDQIVYDSRIRDNKPEMIRQPNTYDALDEYMSLECLYSSGTRRGRTRTRTWSPTPHRAAGCTLILEHSSTYSGTR
jgi:hypothetical protein